MEGQGDGPASGPAPQREDLQEKEPSQQEPGTSTPGQKEAEDKLAPLFMGIDCRGRQFPSNSMSSGKGHGGQMPRGVLIS